jgi:hypothetical protein
MGRRGMISKQGSSLVSGFHTGRKALPLVWGLCHTARWTCRLQGPALIGPKHQHHMPSTHKVTYCSRCRPDAFVQP